MGTGNSIGAPDNRDLLLHGTMKRFDCDGDYGFQVAKSLAILTAGGGKLSFVFEIVVQDQTEVRIVIRPLPGHKIDRVIGHSEAVLHRSAAGLDGRTGTVRRHSVDHRAFTSHARLIACRLYLLVRHGL